MPDITYQSKDAIPEGLREFAKEANGGFVVSVVPKVKLDEFRENNLNIARERDALKDKVTVYTELVGDDLTKAREIVHTFKTTHQQVLDGKLKGTDQIEAAVTQRMAEQKKALEDQIAASAQRLNEALGVAKDYETKFKRSTIDREITNAVLHPDSGVNPAALADILTRAYGFFSVEGPDGKLVARQGEAIVYGTDGVSPMPPKEWLAKVLEQAPYLGKQSAGGGASGTQGTHKAYGDMSKADFDKLPPAQRIAMARKAAGIPS